MRQKTILLWSLLLLISCVQEIPQEEILEETFVDTPVSNNDNNEVIDTTAPLLTNPLPKDLQPGTTKEVILQITTNEPALCRYDLVDGSYITLKENLGNGQLSLTHQKIISVQSDQRYLFYVRCIDEKGNEGSTTTISFAIDKALAQDIMPPTITGVLPSGTLLAGTNSVTLMVTTNENAQCRFSTSSSDTFLQMTPMMTTGSNSHSHEQSNLNDGSTYQYYFYCRDLAGNTSDKAAVSFNIDVLNLDGAALYAENCMSCHMPLSNSTKKNRTAVQIQNAINTNSQMKVLPTLLALTPIQVEAITEALKFNTPPPTPPVTGGTETVGRKYLMGTRKYVASKLTRIFYEQDKDQATLDIISENITKNPNGSFGGICTVTDSNCYGDAQVKTSGLMIPNSQPTRSAIMYNTCQQILNTPRAVSSALVAAGLTTASNGNSDSNMLALFDVFYPGMNPNQEQLDALRNLYSRARSEGLSSANAWKMVMDPMCKSELFEAF